VASPATATLAAWSPYPLLGPVGSLVVVISGAMDMLTQAWGTAAKAKVYAVLVIQKARKNAKWTESEIVSMLNIFRGMHEVLDKLMDQIKHRLGHISKLKQTAEVLVHQFDEWHALEQVKNDAYIKEGKAELACLSNQ